MDPILERKDIICSFENSNGERVSITDSLVIHSLKNDEEESSLIFPIKRLDSYSVKRRQLSEFNLFAGVIFVFWYLWFVTFNSQETCTFLWFGCTESNFFQDLVNGILDGWWALILSAICFFCGFIKETKLSITSISQENIQITINESEDEDKAKEFIKQLNEIYTRTL